MENNNNIKNSYIPELKNYGCFSCFFGKMVLHERLKDEDKKLKKRQFNKKRS